MPLRDDEDAGDEVRAHDLGDGVLACQRAQIDKTGNGPPDANGPSVV
jgi:hypothetical protein